MTQYDPESPDRRHHVDAVFSVFEQVVGPYVDKYRAIEESPQVAAFHNVWRAPPALPGQHTLIGQNDAIAWQSYFRGLEPLELIPRARYFAVVALQRMAGLVGGDSFPGDRRSGLLFSGLVGKMADRMVTSENASAHAIDDEQQLMPLNLSLLLVHAAAIAQIQQAAMLFRHSSLAEAEENTNNARNVAAAMLQESCHQIQANKRRRQNQGGAPAQVEAETINSLRGVYHMGDSDDFVTKAIAVLLPTYLQDVETKRWDTLDPNEVAQQLERIRKQLKRHGIDTDTFGTKLDELSPEIFKHVKTYNDSRRKDIYINNLNRLHAKLRSIYFAKRLVDGIADGSIDYIRHNLRYEDLGDTQILKLRAAAVAVAQNEAYHRRLNDALIELTERARELGFKPFPPVRGEGGEDETPITPSEGVSKGPRKERWRLAAIQELKKRFPGSEVYIRELKKPPKTGRRRRKNVEDDELPRDYCILAIPVELPDGSVEFHAYGDKLLSGNGAQLYRIQWGMDIHGNVIAGRRWQDAYRLDKALARNHGVMSIKHPPWRQVIANPTGTMDRFIAEVVSLIERPLQPRQVIMIGGKAVGGVVKLPDPS